MTIQRDMVAEGILGFLQVLKCYRPGRWQPRVAPANFEHVDAALRAGRGVLLWVAHGFHGHLGAKVGFASAGLAVSHLSRATHGFSDSRFGMRVLNRIQTMVEDRYLCERILIPSQGRAPLDLLARRLGANGVVSITAQRGTGRTVEVPFFDGSLRLGGRRAGPGAQDRCRAVAGFRLPQPGRRGRRRRRAADPGRRRTAARAGRRSSGSRLHPDA
jgi:hypothetical protein